MKKIRISDVTMRQPGDSFSLSFREKIELSKLLDQLGVSVIELEGMEGPRSDALRIKSIASCVKSSAVAVPVSFQPGNPEMVWDALREAKHPRLQVPAALSSVQMEYIHHKKPQAMLDAIASTVKACRNLCEEVEFVADDATRSDRDFLVSAIGTAAQNGAAMVTLCDAAGTMLPHEFAEFVADIRKDIPDTMEVGISCQDTLSMADACCMAALGSGVSEIKAAGYPVTAASLSNISRIISARGDSFDAMCPVNVTSLSRVMEQIQNMCETGRSKTSALSGGIHGQDADILLTAHDSIEDVAKAVSRLGYELNMQDMQKVYDAFGAIAARKEQVSIRELDAIVASAAMQVPPSYKLEIYSIQSGNTASATAHLKISRNGEVSEGVSLGDGPIDAAFRAIEGITGCHYELDDFQIQAVTEGREAMGQTIVKLISKGRIYSGRGISTDIVGASIEAYLSALNKIVYEEEEA